jgi:hypothetical protein
MALTGLGNLTARILLPLERMSTVKIRAGSLFRTPGTRIGPRGAAFRIRWERFPPSSTGASLRSQDVHSQSAIPPCANAARRCKVKIDCVGADAFRPPPRTLSEAKESESSS